MHPIQIISFRMARLSGSREGLLLSFPSFIPYVLQLPFHFDVALAVYHSFLMQQFIHLIQQLLKELQSLIDRLLRAHIDSCPLQ